MVAIESVAGSALTQRRWRVGPSMPARPPVWRRALLATVAILTLLLAFERVLRQAVAQGEQRRRAQAVLADATWRCRIQHERPRRENCLAQLAVPRDNVSLAAPRIAAAVPAATIAR